MTITLIIRYLKTYWVTAALLGYMMISTILKSYSSVDVTIPCLINYFIGHRCYGCGLTTAVTHLLRLDLRSAIEANALVFIVLPVLILLNIRHWKIFKREQENT